MTEEHRYLSLPTSHLSKGKAVALTLSTIRELIPSMAGHTDGQLRHATARYTITTKKGQRHYSFDELAEEARTTGTVTSLRRTVDLKDPVFGNSLNSLGVSENMTLKLEHYGPSVIEVAGPARIYAVEADLAEDILYYRQEICRCSTLGKLDLVGRLYRAYTLSCTTLVEAFLNRHLWWALAVGELTREEVDAMPRSFEPRLEAWLPRFTGRTIQDLRAVTPCWGHFVELRNQRNAFSHAPAPNAGLSYHDIRRGLNSAQTGVAGLLARIREWQQVPRLGFLERLLHAPEVSFVTAMTRTKSPKHK